METPSVDQFLHQFFSSLISNRRIYLNLLPML